LCRHCRLPDSLKRRVTAMNTGKQDPRRLRIVKGAALPDTAAILVALDADEDYDYRPDGDPPITTGQYRRITRAIASLVTVMPDQPLSDTPADAHTQGQIQILDEIRRIFAETISLPTCEPETPS
jgi:hypothetical protein